MGLTTNEIDAHVGQRMRQRREALGVSQGRLGRHLGLTFSQVQKYEKGVNRIGAGRLHVLAGFLGVSVQYFFEGLGDPAPTGQNGRSVCATGELAVLDNAFRAIPDQPTRQSVLALVCSLAMTPEASREERQKAG